MRDRIRKRSPRAGSSIVVRRGPTLGCRASPCGPVILFQGCPGRVQRAERRTGPASLGAAPSWRYRASWAGDPAVRACRYGGANEVFRSQISGMLAVLRRQVLACGWGRDSRPDWDVMLMRADRTGGRVGEYLRAEVVWAMGQVATADEVDLVLGAASSATAVKRESLSTPR